MDAIAADEFPGGLLRLDADARILAANDWIAQWFGVPAEQLMGSTVADLLIPVEDDLLAAASGLGPLMMRRPEDDDRALLVAWPPSTGEMLVSLVDATARYRALRQLRRSYSLADRTRTRLQLVIDAAIALSEAGTEERLAEIVADTAARAYGAEESAVFLLDDRRRLHLAAGSNPLGISDAAAAASGAGALHDVVLVSGVDQGDALAPELGQAMRTAGVDALLVAPLQHEGISYGVLACFFLHPRTFDEEAGPLADALAGQAAQTLVALRLQSRLEHAALHDETTGLPNRRLLEDRVLQQLVGEARSLAVLFLDLDGFKAVNDALGHAVGDDVLRETGRRLQAAVRDGDVVARYGGDEFVVVCGVLAEDEATEIAERLRRAIAAPIDFLPEGFVLGVSIGVAVAPTQEGPTTLDGIIRAADQAMYLAKNGGGNRIVARGVMVPRVEAE
jgi:diguanylate cyclase (GGDEF)-like protein